MNCEHVRESLPAYLDGEVEEGQRELLLDHLRSCAACREEQKSLESVWTKMGALPVVQPYKSLGDRFYTVLDAYEQEMERAEQQRWRVLASGWLERWWPRQPLMQFALSSLLLIVGLGAGYRLNSADRSAGEMAQLHQEVRKLNQLVVQSLLQQQSPGERLKGVIWSNRLEEPGQQIMDALLQTLNHDQNVNVRLAAVDALYLFAAEERVRDGLTRSILQQRSPLVQIALINAAVELKGRQAVAVLAELVEKNGLDDAVKERAVWGMEQFL